MSPNRFAALVAGIAGVWACSLAGCSSHEEPSRYQAPREESPGPVHGFEGMASTTSPGGVAPLAYEAPEHWAPGTAGGMRKAAFGVQDGERKVEITAIDLKAEGEAGELLPNVNRWRRQIELGEITQDELDKTAVPIQVGDVEGRYVELLGPDGTEPRQAILGAMAVREEKAWFFKLSGDAELAMKEKEPFQSFVKSIRFTAPAHAGMMHAGMAHGGMAHGGMPPPPARAGSPLEYDVPEGWSPDRVGGMRKAAFLVQDGDRKVEITAIDLAAEAGELLPNVNRWRKQVALEEISETDLDASVTAIEVGGVESSYVELVGPEDSDPRQAILGVVTPREEKAWFFKLSGDADLALKEKGRFQDFVKSVRFVAAAPRAMAPSAAAAGRPGSPLKYVAPEGWTQTGSVGARQAGFVVQNEQETVEINVIDLEEEAGALLVNVNRWRRQIQLDEIADAQLAETVTPIQVAGVDGHYVELTGPDDAPRRRAILAVVILHDKRAWFFRMTGDAELAMQEKERFLDFLKSVEFVKADGAGNGD